MRSILILIFISGMLSCAPTNKIPATEAEKQMTVSIDAPNISKNELFTRVNEFMVIHFVDSESVIQYSDKEEGKLMGKYVGEYTRPNGSTNLFKCVMSVDVRDNEIRLKFLRPQYQVDNKYSTLFSFVNLKVTMESVHNEWQELADDMEDYVKVEDSW